MLIALSSTYVEALQAFVERSVTFTLVRREDQRGLHNLGIVRRDDVISRFRESIDDMALLKGVKSSALKESVNAVFLQRGRRLFAQVDFEGRTYCNAYKDCAFRV